MLRLAHFHGEGGVEQSLAGEVAAGVELFDEQIEGIVLVGLGIEGVALDLLEVFGKAGVGREVAPQDEGVYKEADQPGGLRVLAAGMGLTGPVR